MTDITNLEDKRFHYKATLRSNYDGDSCRLDLHLGCGVVLKGEDGRGVRCRLAVIDTPELRGEERPAGLVAKEYLANRLKDRPLMVRTTLDKEGKFGRLLVTLYIKDDDGTWVDVNQELLDKGMAVLYGS
jgi:micrococcal nuclease